MISLDDGGDDNDETKAVLVVLTGTLALAVVGIGVELWTWERGSAVPLNILSTIPSSLLFLVIS